MGADAADINHDGYPEIFVTEMLPEPEERVKTVTTFESWDKYQFSVSNGYYHQFTRNMFQGMEVLLRSDALPEWKPPIGVGLR